MRHLILVSDLCLLSPLSFQVTANSSHQKQQGTSEQQSNKYCLFWTISSVRSHRIGSSRVTVCDNPYKPYALKRSRRSLSPFKSQKLSIACKIEHCIVWCRSLLTHCHIAATIRCEWHKAYILFEVVVKFHCGDIFSVLVVDRQVLANNINRVIDATNPI